MSQQMGYILRSVNGHVEVYLHGRFIFSADTKAEALRELEMEESSNAD